MKKYISIIIIITLAVAGSSCKKTFLSELANNPNTPANTTPALALAGALKTTAAIINGGSVTGGVTGAYDNYACWVGYMSWSTGFQANLPLEAFAITTSTYDNFTPLYLNISNYTAMLNSTTEPYFQAIAKIMIAYDFEALVDNYNSVPYFQAIQGATNLTPTYDSGSAIYDDLLKQLDAAITLIQKAPATAATPGTADIMYHANSAAAMNSWIQFANTLKLRIAVRQSTSPTLASKKAALTTDIQATAALGYIGLTSEGTVNPGYTNLDANGGEQQPLALNYGTKQSGAAQNGNGTYQANTYAVNFLTSNNDPRLTQIYQPSTAAGANGAVSSTVFGATLPPTFRPSRVSNFLINPTKSAFIFSASESLFLQAEAANIGYLPGSAATLYQAGVEASFIELGLTAAQADIYLAQASVAYPTGGTPAQQEQAIITQKWIALDPYQALEAYNEFRRTGYPAVPVSVFVGNTSPITPVRIPYPFTEYATNGNNVPSIGSINIFTSKIFWAQ